MPSRCSTIGMAFVLVVGLAGLAGADCPDLAGRWPYAPVQAVTASGTTAYLGSDLTLVVLDVSNPASPAVLGSVILPATINRIAVAGSLAYVAAGAAGLRVVDVSNPAHPTEVSHADGLAYDIAVSGTHVYLAAGDLRIYDVANPAAPVQIGSWSGGEHSVTRVVAAGEFAYVAGPTDLILAGVSIVRVSDPTHPVAVGFVRMGGLDWPLPTDLAVAGNLLLVSESGTMGGAMLILDVSNPAAPVGLAEYQGPSSDGRAVAASGAFAFLAEYGRLSVINIADPRNPFLVSSQPLTTAATAVEVAVTGHTVLVADQQGGLYLFDASACGATGCSLACTPTVPGTAVAGSAVAFQGAYLPSGCTGTPTFDWDFGDGSLHSTEQSPSHSYAFGGTFRWSVTVSLGGSTCVTAGAISVASTLPPITSPGMYAYIVPTSAHKNGFNGTHWVTDLVLTNPGLVDATVRLYFIKGARDNTGSAAHPVIVPLRRALRLVDVVASTFVESNASGAILVGSDVPLIVTSRTYNQTGAGTYGQFVEGSPIGQAFGPGATAWLTGLAHSLTDTVGFRTNIGVVNAGGQHVRVEIALYGGDGIWLGTRTVDLNPYDFQQVDKIFAGLAPSGVDAGYALLSTSTPGAVLFAYASVIDNSTGDPIAVPARVPLASP